MIKSTLLNLLKVKQEIHVSFRNLTSESPSIEGVKLILLKDNGCTVRLPAKTCSLGHQAYLAITVKEDAKVKTVKVLGKVSEVMMIDLKMNEVTIQFTQYSQEEWQDILKVFENKQEIVSNTIAKLK